MKPQTMLAIVVALVLLAIERRDIDLPRTWERTRSDTDSAKGARTSCFS